MGFFDIFKKKEEPAAPGADRPRDGRCRCQGHHRPDGVRSPMTFLHRASWASAAASSPSEGKVYAPVDGVITQAPDSLHALGIQGNGGVEVLIHVGVDTVEMKGDGFSANVKVGDKVKKGQLLLTMDLDKIKAAGHPDVVITVITNTDEFASVDVVASGEVEPGADMIKVTK